MTDPTRDRTISRLVVRDGLVVDVADRSVEVRDVLIEDGVVTAVGTDLDVAAGAKVIDAAGCIVLPGFVNAHSHSYATLCRHDGAGLPLEPFMNYALAGTVGRTEDEVRTAASLQAIEAIRTGTTSMIDLCGGDVAGLSAALAVYEEAGIRTQVAPMVSDVRLEDTVGGAPSGRTAGPTPVSAQRLIDLTLELREGHTSSLGLTEVIFGPSAPQRCSPALLEGIAAASAEREIRVHTHLLETRLQAALPSPSGRSWVDHLDRIGLLTDRFSAAHAVWVDDADLELVAHRGSTLVHNPFANLYGGSGIAHLPGWRRAGARAALGTDSVNGGGSMDMIASMRLAGLLHRAGTRNPSEWEDAFSVLELATAGGARAMGLQPGALAGGTRADLAIFAMDSAVFATGQDPLASLIFSSWDHSAQSVIVGGRLLLEDGVILGLDEERVVAAAAEARAHMQERNAAISDAAREQEPSLTEAAMSVRARRALLVFDPR